MKRVWICLVLALILIIVAVGSYLYTRSVTENMEKHIDELTLSFNMGNYDRTKLLSQELSKEWERYCVNHIFVTNKEHIMEITLSVTRIEALAKLENEDILTESSSAKELISLYRENQTLSPMNIF